MAMPLSHTYTLALLAVAAVAVAATRVVQAEPEPGPSIEAINATCAPLGVHVQCTDLLLENLDVRTPEVKDVIEMSIQVVAKKAAEAAAFAKATIKKPSECVDDCLGELSILTKHIQKLRATLDTAKDAGYFEQRFGKSKCTGNCCSIIDSYTAQKECDAAKKVLGTIDDFRITDALLSKRAFFRKQQQLPKENTTT